MGSKVQKPYLEILGRPLLFYTLKNITASPLINGVGLVVGNGMVDYSWQEIVKAYGLDGVVDIVEGGIERQDSVYCGLKTLPEDTDIVLIHDGARPFISSIVIEKTVAAAMEYGAAITGVRVKDTIKMVDESYKVMQTLNRSMLWAVQTPQAFKAKLLRDCYDKAINEEFYGTDDASIVEWAGFEVRVVDGEDKNIKITTPFDLRMAEAMIRISEK
ncbi:2-C-methyl-D-erythritol 4-phosphate cytidylyltransferase [Candidatus Desantisbacteria bacterium CG_4_9_14_3_um_filter_40_11]|nr:MAG: 2-C-methyl-D-erythritol 4-phosphate cytidylyltransferase [Candidatus Desantisbacteria bacterium CG23_combo_of_CG06-09_8_20_14_all_40_23]PIX15941.1 MAG: 2-C-methyl-D-erythritol 4-phosphate cytidylyltransferase [Candidatus Desantisbacteria bacterium CG_4_8_14_3_um_filter_40_12]PJB30125.1 MAG: 2-C-methyl-D-erythritol 4-phosphate cytidylyltransferase [Candidatus Desantisbacteria bacterium CG_4_9_14_3_um_filter_40_11]